ncbi:MAG: HAMP domain-containing histidine kinase [Gemmatimonadota bacterium]|nr:MAG: HAMP domain-containing histidine kinase [Gemmatimonadota bacterium]
MPLRHRIAAAFVLFAAAALGIGSWVVYRSTRALLERGLDEKLEAVAVAATSGLDGGLVSQLRPGDESTRLFQAYSARLRELAPVSASAFIFDSAGGLLVASWPGAAIGDRVHSLDLYEAEIAEAWVSGTATTTLFRDARGRWYKLGLARLDDGPAVLAVLMPADFLEPLERLRAQMITFALVALAAIGLAAAVLSRGLTRALEQLSGAARRIGKGEYADPVPTGAGGEIGQLARALEEMRVAIIRREEELRLMLAQVAHEIRNPLGGIELFAGAAADGLPAEDERRGHLDKIRSEARELDRVIADFLAFAKPQEPAWRKIDLREPLEEAALMMGDAGSVDVQLELPPEPLWVVADPDQVKRIAVNLLRNAVAAAQQRVVLSATGDGAEVSFSVTDDGSGIADDVRDRIFEPFFTTRADGAGLGLAIVRKLVEANAGWVGFEAQEGKTSFVVAFGK